jgi:hypothetical protein
VIDDLLSASWDPGDAGLAGAWLPGGFEVEYTEPGGREVRAGLDRLRRVDLGSCLPVRSFPSYKGQRNYPSWFWSSTMTRLIGFESWVDRRLPAPALRRSRDGDPAAGGVRSWVRIHRARFEKLRGWSWGRPPPPPERFR